MRSIPLRARLEEALEGADIFLGLSAAGALKPEWVDEDGAAADHLRDGQPGPGNHPARQPRRCGPIAIVATGPFGLSEPGQQRARLPVHLPRCARCARDGDQRRDEDCRRHVRLPNSPASRCPKKSPPRIGINHQFGLDYIIPAPFDPRLMEVVSSAVAKAAMDSGVAQKPIEDFDAYRTELKARLNPTTSVLTNVYAQVKANPKRVVFAEAENEVVLRAAIQYRDFGYGTPVLVGRTQAVHNLLTELGVGDPDSYEIHNSAVSPLVPANGRVPV